MEEGAYSALQFLGRKKQNHQENNSKISYPRETASSNHVLRHFLCLTPQKRFPFSRIVNNLRNFLCERQNQFSTCQSTEVINTRISGKIEYFCKDTRRNRQTRHHKPNVEEIR